MSRFIQGIVRGRLIGPRAAAIFVFLLSAALSVFAVWRIEQQRLSVVKADVSSLTLSHAKALQISLDRSLSAAYALGALVRQGRGAVADFQHSAGMLLPLYPGASALELAPGGIIRDAVPFDENSKALGFNLLADPVQKKEALLARDSGRLTLAGPLNLFQGGFGAVGRLPVFLDERKGDSSFWGFAIVVLRFPDALAPAKLSQLVDRGYRYELWRMHPDTGRKQIIASSSEETLPDPVEHFIDVPNGTWTLSVAPAKGWGAPQSIGLQAVLGLFFSLMLAYLAKSLLELKGHKDGLETLVAERTRELEQDVAARALAEATLRASEERYHALFAAAGEGISILSPDGAVLEINESFARMHGYAKEDMLLLLRQGKGGGEGFAPPRAVIERVMAGESLTFESEQSHKQGHQFPIEVSAGLIFSGGKSYIQCFYRDITDRKKSEQAVRESERRYRRLFEESGDMIFISSPQGRLIDVNPAGVTLLGYRSREDFLSALIEDTYADPADREAFLLILKAQGYVTDYCAQLRRQDGQLIDVSISASAVKNEEGQISEIRGIIRDITEKRKLEEQLRQSQKMESLGTLAGGIAHDFNNNLTAIIGYGHLILQKIEQDDPQKHYIEQMLQAAERAAHLTKDLLLFSRKQTSDMKLTDLNEVVGGIEIFLRRIIGEDITCRTVPAEQPLPILADGHQIEQILMNLVTNARDAMDKGGVLTLTTGRIRLDSVLDAYHESISPGEYAMIRVTDTGKGMDQHTLDRIFEPFYTTKGIGKGTGIGLSVVYGIVRQHKGYMTVESIPAEGTTFVVYLPLMEGGDDGERETIYTEEPGRGEETILVAEDDEALRRLIKSVLEEFGYHVILAVDGEDALARFHENKDRIDLLLTDLIMPRKTGKELHEEIIKECPSMKTIFASGYSPDIVQDKAAPEGDVTIVYKPISPLELLRTVRTVLDRESSGG